MSLGLPLSLEEFNDDAQAKFVQGIAAAAQVDPSKVEILGVQAARRRRSLLAGIIVDVAVAAENSNAASSLIGSLSPENINAELTKLGLPEAQILESPAVPGGASIVAPVPKSSPQPSLPDEPASKDQSAIIIGVAVALGMVVVIVTGWIAVRFFLPSAGKKGKFALGGPLSEIEQRLMLDAPDSSADTGERNSKGFMQKIAPLSPDEHQSSLIEKKAKKSEGPADPQPSWETRLFEELPGSMHSPPTSKMSGQRLKSKIAEEIAEMRKKGTMTATSDVGVFVSLSKPSASQQARLATLPAGVVFAAQDAKSEAGQSEISDFGTASSLLGEAVPISKDAPGSFHGLRQSTMSNSAPRGRASRSSGPRGFSNAGVLSNITSARGDAPTSTGSATLSNSNRGRFEQADVLNPPNVNAFLQPSALPQPSLEPSSTARSNDLKATFSSFTPPPSARGSLYNTQRSVRGEQPSAPPQPSLDTPKGAKEQSATSSFQLRPSVRSGTSGMSDSVKGPVSTLSAQPRPSARDSSLQPSALPQPSSGGRSDEVKKRFKTFSPPPSARGSVASSLQGSPPASQMPVRGSTQNAGGFQQTSGDSDRSETSSVGGARSERSFGSFQAAPRPVPSARSAALPSARSTASLKQKIANEIVERRAAEQGATPRGGGGWGTTDGSAVGKQWTSPLPPPLEEDDE